MIENKVMLAKESFLNNAAQQIEYAFVYLYKLANYQYKYTFIFMM